MREERWLAVVGFEGLYEVSDLGRVRSLDRFQVLRPSRRKPAGGKRFWPGVMLKPGRGSNGYLTVSLCGKSFCVQHLVAAAFIGPRPDGMCVLHRDDVRVHNHLENLRYGTHAENADDKAAAGMKPMGEAYKSAKLSDVKAGIARALQGEISQSLLAKTLGASPSAIQAVHDGRTWKHVRVPQLDQALAEFFAIARSK